MANYCRAVTKSLRGTETIFWVKIVKILKFFDVDADPGSFRPWTRDLGWTSPIRYAGRYNGFFGNCKQSRLLFKSFAINFEFISHINEELKIFTKNYLSVPTQEIGRLSVNIKDGKLLISYNKIFQTLTYFVALKKKGPMPDI
jgi:hypothetical protein